MDLGIKGKTALVVAASKGMGKASALGLAAEGARVVMCARGEAALKDAAAQVKQQTGAEVLALPADRRAAPPTSRRWWQANRAVRRRGHPGGLAWAGPARAVRRRTDEHWMKAFKQVHLSTVRFIREVLPTGKSRWGRILAIQSSSVKQPVDGLVLERHRPGIAGPLQERWRATRQDNITVNLVLPAHHDRPLPRHQTDRAKRAASHGPADGAVLRRHPDGADRHPDEFAAMVVFLASARASYVTGTAVQDGGSIERRLARPVHERTDP
jgi:3-oxoacyl-[acyl-carrier protein] reductase